MNALLRFGAIGAGLFTGFGLLSKAFGGDMDFNQALMINRMSGRGGFFKTFFVDGLKSMFMGSRTASAMFSGGMPFGASMYGNPAMMGMNPYMMNPMAMGTMPYAPMGLGAAMWA